jgi:hypothetical protein
MPRLDTALAAKLATLPTYYGCRDILALFDGDEDAFTDAWCDGSLPLVVRHTILETAAPRFLELCLLRRIVRLLQPRTP